MDIVKKKDGYSETRQQKTLDDILNISESYILSCHRIGAREHIWAREWQIQRYLLEDFFDSNIGDATESDSNMEDVIERKRGKRWRWDVVSCNCPKVIA